MDTSVRDERTWHAYNCRCGRYRLDVDGVTDPNHRHCERPPEPEPQGSLFEVES